MLKKPELAERGHRRRTGELLREEEADEVWRCAITIFIGNSISRSKAMPSVSNNKTYKGHPLEAVNGCIRVRDRYLYM